jgi:hypothetical protein
MFDIGVGEAFVFVGLLVGVGFVGRALIRTVRGPRTRSQP